MTLPHDVAQKYELLSKLGQGGMGAVYKVRHRLLDDLRVIKLVRAQIGASTDLEARFLSEAQAATRLRHPRIAQVFDFAVGHDDVAHIVMEYIDGLTLAQLLELAGPLEPGVVCGLAAQALEGLSYLHRQGYVHRDISPDNLMVCLDTEGRVSVKLIDLGLAKRLETPSELTSTGMFLGKVRYASPEQFGDTSKDADPRSDLYSFGLVVYELLTGVRAVDGDTVDAMVAAHLIHPMRAFDETDPEGRIGDELRTLVTRALAKTVTERIATADDFRHALEAHASGDFSSVAKALAERPPDVVEAPLSAIEISDSLPSPAEAGGATTARTLLSDTAVTTPDRRSVTPRSERDDVPMRSRRTVRTALIAAIGLVAIAAVTWIGLSLTGSGSAEQSVLVRATPWAHIELTDSSGNPVALEESERITPARLRLDQGSFTLRLISPSGKVQSSALEVSTENAPIEVDFEETDVDAYFERLGLSTLLAELGR